MDSPLVSAVRKNTQLLFENADIMLQSCDLDYILCDFPVWKHVYHAFHSCDQWFINPFDYDEPDFHEPDLNSLNVMTEKVLTRADLAAYLEAVRGKILRYVDLLTDDMLCEIPPGCKSNRLSLILSQFRHFYAHLGNINATTILATNQWPRVVGLSGKSGASAEGLYE